MIELKRPLIAFDLEATGTDPKTARILEMAIIKIGTDGRTLKTTSRFNPGVPIPKEASDIHGITDEAVADEPKFADKAIKLLAFIQGCDILGYNSNKYDIPLLFEEFARCGLYWDTTGLNFIDVFRIFTQYEKRDLSAAVRHYLGKELEGAHGATVDLDATCDVFNMQLQKHPDLPKDFDQLSLLCNNGNARLDLYGRFAIDAKGDYIFTFGKHQNKKCKEEIPYLEWMLKSDFSMDTKAWISKILSTLK